MTGGGSTRAGLDVDGIDGTVRPAVGILCVLLLTIVSSILVWSVILVA